MLEPWNDTSLLPPPVHTFPSNSLLDLHELRNVCRNIITVMSNQSPLHKEGAILSRFVYKYDKKFRNDIGYKYFKMVQTALRRYLSTNFLNTINSFNSTLPSSNDDIYLPTRQMLQYVLVKLMTFSKIMVRIAICSKRGSVFYVNRVKRGESHWMSLMPYALLSRVWSMSMVLLRHSCGWYAHLHPWLNKLQLNGMPFLQKSYKFPLDLEEWLDMKYLDNLGKFQWAPEKCMNVIHGFIEDDEGDALENIMSYINQINDDDSLTEGTDSVPKSYSISESPLVNTLMHTDHGEVISREKFKSMLTSTNESNYMPVPKTDINILSNCAPKEENGEDEIHTPASVTNLKSLQDFLDKEEALRNDSDYRSLTAHLSFMQWQALKNSLSTLATPLSNNRKIERKFQKVWKDKCVNSQ